MVLMPFSLSCAELTAFNAIITCFLLLFVTATAILTKEHGREVFLLQTCEGDIVVFYDLLLCDVQRALSDHVTGFVHAG